MTVKYLQVVFYCFELFLCVRQGLTAFLNEQLNNVLYLLYESQRL